MSEENKQLSTEIKKVVSENWLMPKSYETAWRMAKAISSSDLAPKDYKGKPENTLIAIQMGAELGLSPIQAVQNIAVINGRPSIWGDAMLAIVQSHADFAGIKESSDANSATCTVKRSIKGNVCEFTQTFTMQDAQVAGLKGGNVWAKYPRRMMQMRARGFCLRDAFADALKGLNMAEEVIDYEIKSVNSETGYNVVEASKSKAQKVLDKINKNTAVDNVVDILDLKESSTVNDELTDAKKEEEFKKLIAKELEAEEENNAS